MTRDLQLQHDVEQFYYAEAAMLDERRFREWLALFSEDCHYVMPTRSLRYHADARRELSAESDIKHFDDDKAHLSLRVNRLLTGYAWSDEPRSRSRHLIGNVRIRSSVADTGVAVIEVDSVVFVHHGRGEHESHFFSGARRDLLRRLNGDFQIARRTIVLDETVLPTNLGVFF